jgi:hypothetical protein
MAEEHGSRGGTRDPKGCPGTTKDGRECPAPVLLSSGWCYAHDPGSQEARERSWSAGGKGRATITRLRKSAPEGLEGVWELVYWALVTVAIGDMNPHQGHAIGGLARTLIALHGATEVAAKMKELEERLDALARPQTERRHQPHEQSPPTDAVSVYRPR